MENNDWRSYSDPTSNYQSTNITYNFRDISESRPVSKSAAEALAEKYRSDQSPERQVSEVEGLIMQLVTQSNQDRATYYKLLHEFETYYLCSAIYEVLIEEVLRDSGDGVTISVKSAKYQKQCDDALVKFNLPNIVESMLPQLLHYGDYTYRVNKSYKGEDDQIGTITSISDDYSPGEVMGVFNNSTPVAYYRLPQVKNLRNTVQSSNVDIMHQAEKVHMSEILHFTLKSNKIKLELDPRYAELLGTPILNVGVGVLWTVIDRLLLLKFREISTMATDLSRLTRPTLVGAQVPANDSSTKIIEHCRNLEKMLNTTNTDISAYTGSLITSITTAMSNGYKVIPAFSSGRGSASKLDIENQIDTASDDTKLADERSLICQLAGIPPELVLSGQSETSSQRRYVRMNKKVKFIQRQIARSISQFMVHYIATETGDLEVSEADVVVTMNQSTSIEDIDDAESLGYVLDNVGNLLSAAERIKTSMLLGTTVSDDPDSPPEGISPINPKRLMDYLRKEMEAAGSSAASIWLSDEEVEQTKADAKAKLELRNKELEKQKADELRASELSMTPELPASTSPDTSGEGTGLLDDESSDLTLPASSDELGDDTLQDDSSTTDLVPEDETEEVPLT